ncbi:MAG: hypothetical protein OXB88_08340, partial [Bacteriovoracales bacterium]|nr:hypothetical protein [Bacteriovoracales bacterium]
NDLLQMMEEVKDRDRFVELTPSKLASWVVSRYFSLAFKREKKIIGRAHFNHQKHIKEALKKATTEEELRAALASALKQVGRKRKRKEPA